MKKTNSVLILAAAAITAGVVASSIIGTSFAHSHLVVVPDESGPGQMGANPVVLTLGHSNEPSYGAKPGIHDGRHAFELRIEDAATALPLAGANLTLDRYYFDDMRAFNRASSPNDATEIETGIRLGEVFGEPGTYMVRQIVKEGIYGYRVYGTIDYFGVAQIPIDATMFCASTEGNTSKFNSPGWEGSFGCIEDINSLLFPENNSEVRRIEGGSGGAPIRQAALTGTLAPATAQESVALMPLIQIIAVSAVATVGGFFGLMVFRQHRRDP